MRTKLSVAALIVVTCTAAYFVMTTGPSSVAYVAPEPAVPSCTDFECIVTLRTEQNFERDYLKYMEDARLSALQELNLEAQDMVYVSPYITTPSN